MAAKNGSHRYDDIINFPHHQSATHPRMSAMARAAQFSPFAALTGYGEAVEETARWTETQATLGETEKVLLDRKLRLLQEQGRKAGEVRIRYFQPDERKAGGTYGIAVGSIKKIDLYKKAMTLENGTTIPMERIREIDGDCFAAPEWEA